MDGGWDGMRVERNGGGGWDGDGDMDGDGGIGGNGNERVGMGIDWARGAKKNAISIGEGGVERGGNAVPQNF
tara:strand:- start:874 stop:1089 length:216 start_codon:yes stop_codon:yes gene_type:complete